MDEGKRGEERKVLWILFAARFSSQFGWHEQPKLLFAFPDFCPDPTAVGGVRTKKRFEMREVKCPDRAAFQGNREFISKTCGHFNGSHEIILSKNVVRVAQLRAAADAKNFFAG